MHAWKGSLGADTIVVRGQELAPLPSEQLRGGGGGGQRKLPGWSCDGHVRAEEAPSEGSSHHAPAELHRLSYRLRCIDAPPPTAGECWRVVLCPGAHTSEA